jgi:hypothetical protein
MLWLWGSAVRVFHGGSITYELCFAPADRRYLLDSAGVHEVSSSCMVDKVVRG